MRTLCCLSVCLLIFLRLWTDIHEIEGMVVECGQWTQLVGSIETFVVSCTVVFVSLIDAWFRKQMVIYI